MTTLFYHRNETVEIQIQRTYDFLKRATASSCSRWLNCLRKKDRRKKRLSEIWKAAFLWLLHFLAPLDNFLISCSRFLAFFDSGFGVSEPETIGRFRFFRARFWRSLSKNTNSTETHSVSFAGGWSPSVSRSESPQGFESLCEVGSNSNFRSGLGVTCFMKRSRRISRCPTNDFASATPCCQEVKN